MTLNEKHAIDVCVSVYDSIIICEDVWMSIKVASHGP